MGVAVGTDVLADTAALLGVAVGLGVLVDVAVGTGALVDVATGLTLGTRIGVARVAATAVSVGVLVAVAVAVTVAVASALLAGVPGVLDARNTIARASSRSAKSQPVSETMDVGATLRISHAYRGRTSRHAAPAR